MSTHNWFSEMFTSNGKVSMMRFCTFLCVVSGIGCIIAGGITQHNEFLIGGGSLVTLGMGGKVAQKFKETLTQ